MDVWWFYHLTPTTENSLNANFLGALRGPFFCGAARTQIVPAGLGVAPPKVERCWLSEASKTGRFCRSVQGRIYRGSESQRRSTPFTAIQTTNNDPRPQRQVGILANFGGPQGPPLLLTQWIAYVLSGACETRGPTHALDGWLWTANLGLSEAG